MYNTLLIITTLFIAPAGNVAPASEVVVINGPMPVCIQHQGEILKKAKEEGHQVFVSCQRGIDLPL